MKSWQDWKQGFFREYFRLRGPYRSGLCPPVDKVSLPCYIIVSDKGDTEQTLPGPGPLWKHGAMGKTSDQSSTDV